MEIPFLQDILIILGLGVIVALIFHKFNLPTVLGFLATGIIAGPHGLSLVKAVHEVEVMAEVGVILLLFVIGLEFSLRQLMALRKTVLMGGAVQVGLTVLVAALIFGFSGKAWNSSVFLGFMVALSSTAIVLKLLQDRNEINSPQGRIALGILIFQDIIVVPMMLLAPIMSGQSDNVAFALGELALKTLLILVFVFFAAKWLVPKLYYTVSQTRSKELFVLTTVVMCFAVAFLTSFAGLSLALGAFLAGLIISESEYSHQATSNILPFRELFTSIFFVSIGMLLNLEFLYQNLPFILGITAAIFVLKFSIAGLAARILKQSSKVVLITGFTLFQVGEFSFILATVGQQNDLITNELYQYFLASAILSMAVTPFFISRAKKIANAILRNTMGRQILLREDEGNQSIVGTEYRDHLIIIGFGVNGRNVARVARYSGIEYVIIEMNAQVVMEEKQNGENILFGDAMHEHILEQVNINRARVVVVAISDAESTRIIVSAIRHITQQVHLIVRTRYVKEIDELVRLGADEVIPEEFETSIEISSRALGRFLVPLDEIEQVVENIRTDNYSMLRPSAKNGVGEFANALPNLKLQCVKVLHDSGPVVGKTLSESEVRKNFGITILGIQRDNKLLEEVNSDSKILPNDKIYVTGTQENIERFYKEVSEL